jgi:predicted CopG family antitoxin
MKRGNVSLLEILQYIFGKKKDEIDIKKTHKTGWRSVEVRLHIEQWRQFSTP